MTNTFNFSKARRTRENVTGPATAFAWNQDEQEGRETIEV